MALQGLVLFKIDDEEWTLDLRSGKGKVSKGGAGSDKPDLTLTISEKTLSNWSWARLDHSRYNLCNILATQSVMQDCM